MERTVSARIAVKLNDPTRLTFALAVADAPLTSETLRFELDGAPAEPEDLDDLHGTRLHEFVAGPGALSAAYDAVVTGRAEPQPVTDLDIVTYLRPSRYCESDALTPLARERFGGLSGYDALQAVRDWVFERTSYTPGGTPPTGGARETLLSRSGVCRDYAHLTIAMLRALDVPARLVAVYAPGLSPMDFHAVVEAVHDGQWWLLDSTGLAPRASMLRIATGRDAADTAFLTNTLADLEFQTLQVMATVDQLPVEDPTERIQLG